MATKTVVFTPQAIGQAVELSAGSGLWKKQILPVRKVNYKGRTLDFNRRYFTDLANSFKRRAFDQNPIQIADAKNKHNNDPRNFGGELVDLAIEDDGLYGVFRPSGDGAAVLEKNPKIGVSARILEGYQRSDGATFPKALQHVLLTVDPHIPGMKPWEKVELSNEEPDDTIDLSAEFEDEERDMARTTTTKPQNADTEGDEEGEVTLSREEYDAFKEMLAERAAVIEFAADLEDDDEEDESAEGEQTANENEGDDDTVPEQVRLTMEAQSAQILELTNQARAREVEHAVADLQREGLAPAIVEAARPLLGLSEGTIELSNGEELDVSQAVQGLLDAVVGLARNGEAFVEYDIELGRTNSDPEAERREAMLDAWEKQAPA